MNKYQEAIKNIRINANKSYVDVCYHITEKLKAMKYEDEIFKSCNVLDELAEKATPKKVIVEEFVNCFDCFDTCISYEEKIIKCPSCGQSLYDESEEIDLVGWDCCPRCGQALDWGDGE